MLGSIILSTLLLTQSASSSSSSNETKEICPAGAFGANGECYFYSNREMNWYEAVEVIISFFYLILHVSTSPFPVLLHAELRVSPHYVAT